jgi:hypothetical protein
MSEDLFSQLFELFNQPGPVNWRLAREVSDHLTGDPEPIDPWLADEYQQLTRLAQLQITQAWSIHWQTSSTWPEAAVRSTPSSSRSARHSSECRWE